MKAGLQMFKKMIVTVLVFSLALSVLSACRAEVEVDNDDAGSDTASVDLLSTTEILQLTPITPGEELMVMHTSMGDITIRFFPTEAPIAVDNFINLARSGFYDGLTFHRVMNGFMLQGGCPNGNGTGGEAYAGGRFDREASLNVRHFRGALAMAHSGPGTNGSQFYIVQNDRLNPNDMQRFEQYLDLQDQFIDYLDGERVYVRDIYPVEVLLQYMRYGGTPWLDFIEQDPNGNPPRHFHTVFGHVVEGMDVVDAIAGVTVRGDERRPLTPITIDSISFITHQP